MSLMNLRPFAKTQQEEERPHAPKGTRDRTVPEEGPEGSRTAENQRGCRGVLGSPTDHALNPGNHQNPDREALERWLKENSEVGKRRVEAERDRGRQVI